MSFTVMRLSSPQCAPNCPEWIAASGSIHSDTPLALADLLSNRAYRRLPIVLNSPGGDVGAAMQMGWMIHRYGMTTAVGYSLPKGCSPYQPEAPGCDVSGDHRVHEAVPFYNAGYCFSACPLILLGGAARYADPGAHIGLHQTHGEIQLPVDHYRYNTRMSGGHELIASRELIGQSFKTPENQVGFTPELKAVFDKYLNAIGAPIAIEDEMAKASPDSINLIETSARRQELGLVSDAQLSVTNDLLGPDHCKTGGELADNCTP